MSLLNSVKANEIISVLIFAYVKKREFYSIRKILSKGVDVNIKDVNEKSLMYYAIVNDDLEMVKLLLDFDIYIDEPIFILAIEKNVDMEIIKLLYSRLCTFGCPLSVAFRTGYIECVKFLISEGFIIEERLDLFELFEYITCYHSNKLELIELFIDGVYSIQPYLYIAIKLNKLDVFSLLIDKGAKWDDDILRYADEKCSEIATVIRDCNIIIRDANRIVIYVNGKKHCSIDKD